MAVNRRVSEVVQFMQSQTKRIEELIEPLSKAMKSEGFIESALWIECKECLSQVQYAKSEISSIAIQGCTERQSGAMFDYYYDYQVAIRDLAKLMYPNTY